MHVHLLARALIVRSQASGHDILLAHQLGAAHTFLPGGHVEPGESLATTLPRELREEMGVESRVLRYLGAVEAHWPAAAPTNYEVNHIFLLELLDPPAALAAREGHLEFFWAPVAALGEHVLLPEPLRTLIPRYLAGDQSAWWATTLPTEP